MNLFKKHKVTSNMVYNIQKNINELYEDKKRRNIKNKNTIDFN